MWYNFLENKLLELIEMNNTKKLVTCALLIAIIIIMSFTPLGYLKTPFLSITFMTIPVMIGAILIGPGTGALLGCAFGITSYIQAITGASPLTALLFVTNPFFAFIVCVVTRTLMGYCCGLIFRLLRKIDSKHIWTFIVAAFSAPALNTVFFMTALVTLFWNTLLTSETYGASVGTLYSSAGGNMIVFIALFVGVNAVIEAVTCTAIGSAISGAVYKTIRSQGTDEKQG